MLEEYIMDKKQSSNRSNQQPFKGINPDSSKKNQDAVSNKPWNRGGRRREPTGGNFPSKPETSRKTTPQRNKTIDKRPRPRGSYYSGGNVGGNENARLAEEEAELGSVFAPGSKKQNISHLLNFQYTARDGEYRPMQGYHRAFSNQKHKKYNKEHFLQANCQFVVNSEGNYTQYMNDPDALVDWDLIEQIHVQVSEFPSCPICLYAPVAAKMTRCGHVYCWPCILHYLALSDKTWRKCPICYEAIHKQDLKSAVAMPHTAYKVGDTITMRLMRRERDSLTIVAIDQINQHPSNTLLNISEANVDTVYSKLLLANSSEVMGIINREYTELGVQLSEDEDCPEKCFIEQAIEQLNVRKIAVLKKIVNCQNADLKECNVTENITETNENSHVSFENLSVDLANIKIQEDPFGENCNFKADGNNRRRYESVGSEGLGSDDTDDFAYPTSSNSNGIPSKFFYFYQASDGQHIYLHPINANMLQRMYGSLEHCPTIISGKIVEKDSKSMDEILRNRYRYLQHLPLTCEFETAEIQLLPPLITKEILDTFKDEIEQRRKKRQRKARDERRHEKRVIQQENRLMGRHSPPHIEIQSQQHFPVFNGGSPPDGFGFDLAGSPSNYMPFVSDSTSPHSDRSSSPEPLPPSVTFAKMLSKTKPRNSWPTPDSTKPKQTPPKLICVTGASSGPRTANLRAVTHSDSEPEPEGYVPAPSSSKSFGDAFELALQLSAASNATKDSAAGKKKKKKQKKILFATGMTYTG